MLYLLFKIQIIFIVRPWYGCVIIKSISFGKISLCNVLIKQFLQSRYINTIDAQK